MAHFDAAAQTERTLPVRARVAFDDVAQVLDANALAVDRDVAVPVHADVVIAVLVGATAEVGQLSCRAVDDHGNVETDGAQRTRPCADPGADVGLRCELELLGDTLELCRLDLVQVVIPAQHECNHLAVTLAAHDECLYSGLECMAEEIRGFLHRAYVRGRDLFQFAARRGALTRRRQRLCELDVRGVVGAVRERDQVFARVGKHLELMRLGSADVARVREHRTVVQTDALEDAGIAAMHRDVCFFEAGGV